RLEEQRLTKPHEELDALAHAEALGIHASQPLTRCRQVVSRMVLTIALQVRTGRDDVGAVGPQGAHACLLCERNGLRESPLVVERSWVGERVAFLGRRSRTRGPEDDQQGCKRRRRDVGEHPSPGPMPLACLAGHSGMLPQGLEYNGVQWSSRGSSRAPSTPS